MECWDLSDADDMNQLDASFQRRRRPAINNAPSSSNTPIVHPLPAQRPIDIAPLLRGNGAESPASSYQQYHSLYNHHPESLQDRFSPRFFERYTTSSLDQRLSRESTPTENHIERPEHLLFLVGSQFGEQDYSHIQEYAQPQPRFSGPTSGPALWLLFIRIAVALFTVGFGAYRLSKEPLTQTRVAILAVGLLIAAATGYRSIVMRQRFKDTVDMFLLCLVSIISLAAMTL